MKRKPEAKAGAVPGVAANGEGERPAGNPPAEVVEAPVKITPLELVVGIVFLLGLALSIPIITGFNNPIGLLIVGFALWEAFKINRKTPLVITGPHLVGPGPQLAPAHV
jgi:hypothetical protein